MRPTRPDRPSIIMRRDHRTPMYDADIDPSDDLTEQFWGATRGWTSREQPVVDRPAAADRPTDATTSIKVIKDGFAAFRPRVVDRDQSGEFARTRQHGVTTRDPQPEPPAVMLHEASIGELGAGYDSVTSSTGPVRRGPRSDDTRYGGIMNDNVMPDEGRPADAAPDGAVLDGAVPQGGRLSRSVTHVEVEPVPNGLADRLGIGAVDPFVARIGVAVALLSLLVPLALALRPSGGSVDGDAIEAPTELVMSSGPAPTTEAAGSTTATAGADSAVTPTDPAGVDAVSVSEPSVVAPVPASSSTTSSTSSTSSTAATPSTQTVASTTETASSTEVGDTVQRQEGTITEAASATTEAERTIPACPLKYTAGPGDSWYGIADRAGISPSEILAENRATVETVIFPGDEICLPAGATVPVTPTTTTPATTTPATTTPATTVPVTTTPVVTAPPSAAEIERIIREIWPDDQEERALLVVSRESGFDPTAHNGHCCYGLFQIYYEVHRSWLTQFGIYQASDLYDARKNVTAAYALYQDAGGWSPWAQTAY